jgi:hypothetical protein
MENLKRNLILLMIVASGFSSFAACYKHTYNFYIYGMTDPITSLSMQVYTFGVLFSVIFYYQLMHSERIELLENKLNRFDYGNS